MITKEIRKIDNKDHLAYLRDGKLIAAKRIEDEHFEIFSRSEIMDLLNDLTALNRKSTNARSCFFEKKSV